jgi:hypothetical protein
MKFRNDSLDIDANDPFANDALERKPIVEFVETVITKAEGPMVLALDSPWGTGKTTFVKMLSAQLERKNFHCIYFNAWSVDYATDPLAALVSKISLLDENENKTLTNRVKKLKSIATLVGKRGLIAAVKATTLGGLDLEKEYEAVLAQGNGDITSDLFDFVTKEGELLAKFKEELQAYVQDLQKEDAPSNLIFFVDELDRCRPDFAIELLERIKHLFDVPNIIFVLSIHKAQLAASASAIYGSNFNAIEYLRRFIDLDFQIPLVSGRPFVEHMLHRFRLDKVFQDRKSEHGEEKNHFIKIFCFLAEATNMPLRTQEQSIARLALVMDQVPPKNYMNPVLAAVLIVTRALNSKLYVDISNGNASTEEFMRWLGWTTETIPTDAEPYEAASIEASINIADRNLARKAQRITRLKSDASNELLSHHQREYAQLVLGNTNRFTDSHSHVLSLSYLIEKIDLAANAS